MAVVHIDALLDGQLHTSTEPPTCSVVIVVPHPEGHPGCSRCQAYQDPDDPPLHVYQAWCGLVTRG